MCDTLCFRTGTGTVFAKNSDRPVTELQVVERHRRRPAGRLRTQYLDIDDPGGFATVLSRPAWLWGAEHGVNEHRVAIGNEMVHTVVDPTTAPPALIGMDLVRLGLERARSADEAVEEMTTLLERHGQGGIADDVNALAYWSSFLVADSSSAWVLETSGRSWAARRVEAGAAISNRLTIGADWTRASADVVPGTDIGAWQDPGTPTGFADGRLAAGRAFVAGAVRYRIAAPEDGAPSSAARAAVAHMRDHGTGPWGAPGGRGPVVPAPTEVTADGSGVTVCMHVRDFEATTAAMVAELPEAGGRSVRLWLAVGSPCASVFVPGLGPDTRHPGPRGAPEACISGILADKATARRLAALARHAERQADALASVRAVLDPLEADLFDEADTLGDDHGAWTSFVRDAGRRLVAALDALAAGGAGERG